MSLRASTCVVQGNFILRKVALGTCNRPYGTPCQHEHACFSELSSHRAEDFPEMDPNEGMLSSVAAAFRWSVASIWASLSLTPL
jgi:hypothetical protein